MRCSSGEVEAYRETSYAQVQQIESDQRFQKIISKEAIVELVKSILKIGLIVYVVYSYLKDKYETIFLLYDISLKQAIGLIGELVTELGIRVSLVYLIVGF